MTDDTLQPRAAQRGFSLLEVLVTLAIIGIVTGLASIGLGAVRLAHQGLHKDAQRLAQLFPIAQAQARSRGLVVVWEYDEAGYRFRFVPQALELAMGRVRGTDLAASHPPQALRARAWHAETPVHVRVNPEGAQVFDGEWMPQTMRIELRNAYAAVAITRHGDGRYAVQTLGAQ